MRKRTIKCLVDEIFWSLIYILPLIAMALVTYRTGAFVGVSESMSAIGFNIVENNFVFTCLNNIFGANGIVPLLSSDILSFLSYFVCAWLIHLAVDFLLWLPRWFHSLMKGEKFDA